MSDYSFEQNMACADNFSAANGIEIEFVQDIDQSWNVVYIADPTDTEFTYVPLDQACATFGTSGLSFESDPVGWTFESVNTAISGVGGIFNNILGIFGLGSSQSPTDYSDPNALDQAQSRQQMNLILGFVAIVGLIMAGVYYSRKK